MDDRGQGRVAAVFRSFVVFPSSDGFPLLDFVADKILQWRRWVLSTDPCCITLASLLLDCGGILLESSRVIPTSGLSLDFNSP